MASGFTDPENVHFEIQAVVQAAVHHARQQIGDSTAISLKHCLECSSPIPERRRAAVKGVKYCITCQEDHDSIFKRDPRNCWHRSMK